MSTIIKEKGSPARCWSWKRPRAFSRRTASAVGAGRACFLLVLNLEECADRRGYTPGVSRADPGRVSLNPSNKIFSKKDCGGLTKSKKCDII